MKVLFSGDWHIKLGQKKVPREWQKNRYNLLFNEIYSLEDTVDIHIIGGDIFDNIPKPEELELFFTFISGVKVPTFIYDGNHEATRKGKTFLTHLKLAASKINDKVHIVDGITEIDEIDIIPYTHLKTFNPKDFHNKILCTHVRGRIEPHVVPEIDLSLFDRWDVVLAGDLHSYANSQRNILYPGSPLSITFHRQKIENGVIVFDTKTHEHEWIALGLPQLLRMTVDKQSDIIKTGYDHTIYELTGNVIDLSSVSTDSSIIDKKIIDKSTNSTLEMKDFTLAEELQLYLEKVLKLSKEEVDDVLGVFHDYNSEAGME